MKTNYTKNCTLTALRLPILVCFIIFSTISWGQQLAGWQFGTPATAGNEVSLNPTYVNPEVTVSPLTRGAGISAYTLGRGFSSINWNATSLTGAITNNEYYQFSIKVKDGAQFFASFNFLRLNLRRSENGPREFIWRYKIGTENEDYKDVAPSIRYITEQDEGLPLTLNLWNLPDLNCVENGKTITFRLYAWDAIVPSTGTFAIGRTTLGTTNESIAVLGNAGVKVNPALSTPVVTDIVNTTAIANVAITTVGFPIPFESGVCWSKTTEPTTANFTAYYETFTSNVGTNKAYMKDLEPNTKYYVRSFYRIGAIPVYSPVETFTSGSAVATITYEATKKFTYNHQVFAATHYRGRNYTLYNVNSSSYLYVADLNIDNSLNITQDNNCLVNGGPDITFNSGSLVVLNDTLFAFYSINYNNHNNVFYCPCIVDKNGKITMSSTWAIDKVDLLDHPAEHEFNNYIATTVYKNEIYMVVQRNDEGDNKLYLIKGRRKPSGNFFSWSYVDTVKDEDGNPINMNYSNYNDSFDLTTVRCGDGTDSLVVGRSSKNKITLYWYREGQSWKTYEKPVNQNITSCFKMIQGAFAGTGAIEEKNTLQCIGKNSSYTYTEAFDIDGRKFVGENQLKQRDGSFAACATIVGNINRWLSQQYITLVTGDLGNQTDVDTYKSNKILQKEQNASTDVILKTPSLRGLATLVGIVEGPPPSALETQAEYDISYIIGKGSPATLKKDASCTTTNSTATTFTGGGEVGVDFGAVSASVAYKREVERNTTKALTNYQSITIGSKSIEERDSAILFYDVPNVTFNSFYLCTPSSISDADNEYTIVVPYPIMTDITIAGVVTKEKRISLKDAPFDVPNPKSLDCWRAENRWISGANGNILNPTKGSSTYNFTNATSINSWFNQSLAIKTNKSNEISVSVEAKFFKVVNVKATASYKVSKTKESTFSDQLKLEMTDYRINNNIGGRYTKFETRYDLWTVEGNKNIAEHYYSALRNKDSLCLKSETPWIVTYRVYDISYGTVTNLAETNSTLNNFGLKLYRQGESSISLDINSLNNDFLTVELYSLSGQKVQTLLYQRPITTGASTLTTECNVPTGVYVLKSHTSNGFKSSLVRL